MVIVLTRHLLSHTGKVILPEAVLVLSVPEPQVWVVVNDQVRQVIEGVRRPGDVTCVVWGWVSEKYMVSVQIKHVAVKPCKQQHLL